MKKTPTPDPTPTLPLPGEGVKEQACFACCPEAMQEVKNQGMEVLVSLAPPPDKGEVGRGSSRMHNFKRQKNNRCQLRKNQTEPEKRFWSWVRGKQLGVKFRRQHGIGNYIVDFYCAEFRLIIELDGDSHYTEKAKKYDDERTAFLNAKGFRVIRFTNLEVMNNKEGVLEVVLSFLV